MKALDHERRTETELIAGTLAGDTRAFERLMRLNNRALYRAARAILRDDALAEDVVQEAWLRAYRALGTFRGDSKLSTWLVRIAVNEALMHRRRNAKIASAPGGDCIAEVPGPEREAERQQLRNVLETHIDALPHAYRAVFVLRALEEFTVGETADALEIPEATVRTRYFRARGLLREWMKAEDFDRAPKAAFAFAGVRCDRVVRCVLAVVAATVLAGCGERPARSDPEAGRMSY